MSKSSGGNSGFRGCAVEPASGLAPSGINPGRDYEAWRPALIAFYKADAWFQSAENLERGTELNSGDRRIIDALIEAAEHSPLRKAA